MQKLKKQIMATGLILLMAMPLFFSLASLLQQKWIQYQQEKERESMSMQTLMIQAEDLHWIRPGKEISLHGKLFDVRSIRAIDGAIAVTGYFDDEETELVSLMNRLSGNHNGKPGIISSIAIKFLLLPVFSDYHEQADNRFVRSYLLCYPSFSESIPDNYQPSIDRPPSA